MNPVRAKRRRMYFWADESFDTMRRVAEAAKSSEWPDYAAFCVEYERGLRSRAFAILDRFVSSMQGAPFADRRKFVSWLLTKVDGREGRRKLIPQPLQLRIIEPTLLEWTEVEPRCAEPHRWLGGYDHLKQAIELDPLDAIAKRKLVVWILRRVGFSTHELPIGYLGSPEQDLSDLEVAEAMLPGLPDESDRGQFAVVSAEDREIIQKHLRDRPV
jgi:hypothetical protein